MISFSWDIQEKLDKISKANPHTCIHMNPLFRNPGSAPEILPNAALYVGFHCLPKYEKGRNMMSFVR